MKNPVIIAARMSQKRNVLEPIQDKIAKLLQRQKELEDAVADAETDEDLDTIEAELDELETELADKNEKKTKLEDEISGLEKSLEESNKYLEDENNEKERGKDMRNTIETPKVRELRQGINDYVKAKGTPAERNFTTVEGGALLPEELLTPEKAPEDVVDLEKYVRVRKVNSGSGKYPVISKSGNKMSSVAELEQNPKLSNPDIAEVAYDIETYRGYIPISQEMIDDADYDVTGLIAEELDSQELNTRNHEILTVLKTATAKTVNDLDGLKKVFNVDLSKVYSPKAFVSSSLYNALDTMKDNDGRYLLQNNIAVSSGKTLFGKEVVVLDDDMIGAAPEDMVAFIGDAKAFMTLFDRKQASIKWVDHNIYGELLAIFTRFDVQQTDANAGFYVTYVPSA